VNFTVKLNVKWFNHFTVKSHSLSRPGPSTSCPVAGPDCTAVARLRM